IVRYSLPERGLIRIEVTIQVCDALSVLLHPRRILYAQSVSFLPDTFLGIVWRFEFPRVVQGRLALLVRSTRFSKSSCEGFWPEMVRKKTGSWATSFSSLRM